MKRNTIWSALVLYAILANVAIAQCSRGGGGGAAARRGGSAAALRPIGVFNPITTNTAATLLAQQRLAQQWYLMAQQQRYLEELAQSQQNLASQLAATRSRQQASEPDGSQFPSAQDNVRRQRRQRNAEKAFAQAERAEVNGRVSAAKTQFRRVMRILPESTSLHQRAADALARLNADNLYSQSNRRS